MKLLLALALIQSSALLTGQILDPTGAALAGVTVTAVCNGQRMTVQTDATGHYRIDAPAATRCQITASRDGFGNAQSSADLTSPRTVVDFKLSVRPYVSQIVVTPARGATEDTARVAQVATVVDRSGLETRPYTIVTQALKEEAGVLAQQTTASQGSPILRGFTGQRNLYLIDGVRYNTAAWRDGPSQYLAWLPAGDIERIELVRGPASTQYGSDAMGGAVGVFAPSMTSNLASRFGGNAGVTLGAANQMRTSDVSASYMGTSLSLRAGASVGEADDLRAGEGIDSHAAVTRFLGLPSSAIGDKLENTGHRQSGLWAAARVPAGNGRGLSFSFRHSDVSGDHRYDQEIGGNGQYRSEFGPQVLDFGFVRYESA